MNRHTIALAGAATAVLMSAAALATAAGDAPTTIDACRNTGTASSASSSAPTPARATRPTSRGTSRGRPGRRAGRAGRAGRASPARRATRERASARSTRSRARPARRSTAPAGHVEVGSTATDLIMLTLRDGRHGAATADGQRAGLVINEVDYDQVGADTGGFVEIANTGTAAATLDGTALVLVNGGDGTEYGRKALTGTLARGSEARRRRRSAERRARRPRARRHGQGRAARRAQLRGRDPRGHDRHARCSISSRGRCCPSTSPTRTRSRGRSRGSPTARTRTTLRRTGSFTTTPTPGAANVKTP